MAICQRLLNINLLIKKSAVKYVHTSETMNKICSGRYKPTLKQNKPLTYEMSCRPFEIAHKKSWNSWNTSNIKDGNRSSETLIDDLFIRKFMTGTWHNLILSEVIIKRQHNIVRIAFIMSRKLSVRQIYFLTGYSQEMLSYWLHCPVKLELVTLESPQNIVFKYI